jgi:hypothetical protein
MKRFLFKSFLFTVPTLILIISLELFITFSPNTFYLKSKFFKNNIDSIEVLVLGSSHHQNAINPSYIDFKTSNLAYGGQDVTLDSSLFFKYINKLNNLKVVVLEYDDLTFNKKKEPNYFRLPWYYRFYDVEPHPIPVLKKISMYTSSPTFFNKFIEERLFYNSYNYEYSDSGFIKNDFPGVFESLNYDYDKIKQDSNTELERINSELSINHFESNKAKLNSIINYCSSNNIIVILSKTPNWLNNQNSGNGESVKLMRTYLDSIKTSNDIFVFDMSTDTTFNVKDFKDFTHLNSDGAKKCSQIFNDYLKHTLKTNSNSK